jgi:fluoride exporter
MAPSSPLSNTLTTVRYRTGGWRSVAAVAAGGLVGSATRTVIGAWIPTPEAGFPTGVVLINLTGSLFLGFYLARRERAISRRTSLQFWAIGMFGSFTTFSTFSVDLLQLLAAGRTLTATSYLGVSILGGLGLALAGQRLGAAIP